MPDDTLDINNLGDDDSGTIEPTPDPTPTVDPTPSADPVPADEPTPAAEDSAGDDEFLKYVKLANDLHPTVDVMKTYGADNELQFGEVEETEYVENEETEKEIFNLFCPEDIDNADEEGLEEETWLKDDGVAVPESEESAVEEDTFNNPLNPEAEEEAAEELEEKIFNDECPEAEEEESEEEALEEETFSLCDYAAESAKADSPLNEGEAEELEEDTFNEPAAEAEEEEEEYSGDYIREMILKLLPTADAESGEKVDPEWTFGKFMKEKFPSYVASDKAAKFLDIVAQYSVVDAVERLAVQEAKEEVLAANPDETDQDALLALVQEAAEAKRLEYVKNYVKDPEEDEAKYKKFWKDVLDIIKAM